ncbi:O-antigen ligase family protein [Sunxiuqinia elliptica]
MRNSLVYIGWMIISTIIFHVSIITGVLLLGVVTIYAIIQRKRINEIILAIVFLGNPFIVFIGNLINITATNIYIASIPISLAYLALTQRKVPYSILSYSIVLIMLICLLLLQTTRSQHVEYGTYKLIYFLIYFTASAIPILALDMSKEIDIRVLLTFATLFYCFLYINLELSVIKTIQFSLINPFGLRGLEKFDAIGSPRLSSVGLIGIAYCLIYEKRINYLIIIISTIIFSVILIFSETKQAIFASIFCIFLLTYNYFSFKKQIIKFHSIILFLFLAIYIWIWDSLEIILSYSRLTDLGSTFERFTHWTNSIKTISEFPIMGIGLGSYGDFYWPHNIFLESWVELGLFGLLIVFSITGILGVKIFESLKKNNSNPIIKLISLWAVFYLLTAQVSADIARNYILFVFPLIFFSQKMPSINND